MALHPAPEHRNRWARSKAVVGAISISLMIAALLGLGYALRAVALLLLLSILFAYLLAPLVALCETPFRWRGKERSLPRGAAIAATYTSGMAVIGGGLLLIVPRIGRQLSTLDEKLPLALSAPQQWGQSLFDRYHSYRLPPVLRDALDQAANEGLEAIHQSLREGLHEAALALRFLPWVILIPVIAVFLLKDAVAFRSSVLGMLPVGRARWRGADFFEDVNRTIAFFVRAQLFACLFIGLVCTIGFVVLRIPFAWLLGGLACVLELIPMVGPLVTALAVGLVAGARSPTLAIYALVFLGGLRVLHDNVIYPRLIASGIKLHPLAVILALLCGAQLAGAIGLFLAIPLTAFFAVSYKHLNRQWQDNGFFAELFKAREPEPVPVPAVRLMGPSAVLPVRPPSVVLAGVRVLVVDDDEDSRSLLANLLESRGAVVAMASTGLQAIELLKQEKFDVLLSDIGMPDEDGFALIRRVRALDAAQGGNTPAAALTGYTLDEDRFRASAAGFQRHLGKPIDADQLLETVAVLARMQPAARITPAS